jgi:hypothetical protein
VSVQAQDSAADRADQMSFAPKPNDPTTWLTSDLFPS